MSEHASQGSDQLHEQQCHRDRGRFGFALDVDVVGGAESVVGEYESAGDVDGDGVDELGGPLGDGGVLSEWERDLGMRQPAVGGEWVIGHGELCDVVCGVEFA